MAVKSAFASATRKVAGTAKKAPRNIIPASDLIDPDNQSRLYTKEEIIEAMNDTAEGKRLEDQGLALQEMHRTTLVQFVKRKLIGQWVKNGDVPQNPKLSTNSDGTGTIIGAALVDRQMVLDDEQFQQIVSVIGQEKADANVVHRDAISFNADKLNIEVEIKPGKTKKVLEIVDEAITNAFKALKREDLLEGLFEIKEVFTTKKGLLPKALELVGGATPGAQTRMYDLFQAARVTTNIKPGAKEDEEEEDEKARKTADFSRKAV